MLRVSMSGSSPWTLSTISTGKVADGRPDAVGSDGRAGSVITARAPGRLDDRHDPLVVGRDENEIHPAALRARSRTRTTMGTPAMG